AAWTGGQPAHVVGDLVERGGYRLEGPVGMNERVGAGPGLRLFGGGHEGKGGQLGELRRHAAAELRMRVEAGPDGRSPQGQLGEVRKRRLHVLETVIELRHVAGELLAQGEGRRFLEMGASDL